MALETVAEGSYAVAIRQGNIDIKNSFITTTGTKSPIAKIYNGGELFFPMSPRYQYKIKEYQLMHQISILMPK